MVDSAGGAAAADPDKNAQTIWWDAAGAGQSGAERPAGVLLAGQRVGRWPRESTAGKLERPPQSPLRRSSPRGAQQSICMQGARQVTCIHRGTFAELFYPIVVV